MAWNDIYLTEAGNERKDKLWLLVGKIKFSMLNIKASKTLVLFVYGKCCISPAVKPIYFTLQ